MNRIPTLPFNPLDFQRKCREVCDAVKTTMETWVEQQVAAGVAPDVARSEAASGLLSASLNQYFKLANIPADKGADLAVKITMVLAAGITQIQGEMGQ